MDLSLSFWMADKKELYYFDCIIIFGSEMLYDFVENKITNDELKKKKYKNLTSKDYNMKEPEITASRGPPKKVKDLVHKGVKYSAPWGKMGYIEARDVNTDEILWDLKVYEVNCLPTLERDVQERYIVSLEVKNEGLEIINEGNEKYFVDLETKNVKKV